MDAVQVICQGAIRKVKPVMFDEPTSLDAAATMERLKYDLKVALATGIIFSGTLHRIHNGTVRETWSTEND